MAGQAVVSERPRARLGTAVVSERPERDLAQLFRGGPPAARDGAEPYRGFKV
jgi:hypothetical protein